MYAKMFVILMLAMLAVGCTDPDILDPGDITPGSPAFSKIWNEKTQTISIVSPVNTTWLTIEKVSVEPNLCTFTEILNVTAHVNYNLNSENDFVIKWNQLKGEKGIEKVDIYKLNNQSYEIIIDDYDTIQVNQTIYNNETGLNETTTVNRTVVTGNHTEIRYRDVWQDWTPAGNTLFAGESAIVKIVYHKSAELGDVRIQTIPVFGGMECEELTWWNTSWDYRKNITVTTNGTSTPVGYQVLFNITYEAAMNASFNDIRFTNSSDEQIPYWIESKVDSDYAHVWVNLSDTITDPGSDTVWMYYGNAEVSDGGVGNDTFIAWHGAASTKYLDALTVSPTQAKIQESKFRITGGTASNIMHGLMTTTTYGEGDISEITGDGTDRYHSIRNDGTQSYKQTATGYTVDTWYKGKIVFDGTNSDGYVDEVHIGTGSITTNLPNENMGLGFYMYIDTGEMEYSFVRKYIANEPTYSVGDEEDFGIVSYAPETPLTKTEGDSQLFNVTANNDSQCRWYINESLVQTNETLQTEHNYTNTSLDIGYWNFSAVVNLSGSETNTAMQTWWVTVTDPAYYDQDMYIDRWMYVTYLNDINLNLSEFFTQLSPYYLTQFNATAQKSYGYKSGRWEKYGTYEAQPGEAVMLRYTANITKNRHNATGTFGLTLKTGLNHIGHSYNGTRTLSWYNDTIASSNLSTITYQKPDDGTLYTYTYNSTDNETIEVPQGCGVEANVTAETVISGL